jgi:hypothetical protein
MGHPWCWWSEQVLGGPPARRHEWGTPNGGDPEDLLLVGHPPSN